MATSVTCLSSPPFIFKTQELLFPSHSNPHPHDRYGCLTAGSRRNSYSLSKPSRSSSSRLTSPTVRAEADSSVKKEPMLPPYNVLITGSTKGIGYALAKEFLKAGDNVIVCSRSAEHVESAVLRLREEFGEQHVWGTKCDVREGQDVKDLVAFAQKNLKYVDIWVIMSDLFSLLL
ncbi:hypothetical protein Patl1_05805 [Pistacia atlantica]|uniref:Uncharacterized protein n=1 Tax=Pistacia atlantica TaxID=434234 RepID=A0ACC1BU47_9ROSI|nr:hypothetical protein Patl1_05805 [Pistacia atlantica]